MVKIKKTYQELEKEKNFKQIMILLKKKRITTKSDLSIKLNLSVPTVTKIINEMLEMGIIFESELFESTGGRKALSYEFVPDSLLSIGVKIELNFLQLALINLDGKIIKRKIIEKNFIENLEILDILTTEIQFFIFEIGIFSSKVQGIGISVPGIIDNNELILKIGTNFKLYNIDFESIQKTLKYKVIIENEANAACFAEFSNMRVRKSILVISIGTGIGAGIILEGIPYKGSHRKAGEIGHITLYPHGKKCNCGNEGCWEMYCSNTAIIDEFNKEFGNIKSLKDVFNKKIITTEMGQKLLDSYIENLSIGIKDLLLIFDCDKIVISGEICNYSKHIKSKIDQILFDKDVFYKDETKKLEFSDYREDANLIGAGLLAFKNYLVL